MYGIENCSFNFISPFEQCTWRRHLIMSFHGSLPNVTRNSRRKFRFDIIVELVRSDRRESFPECTWESSGIWIKGERTSFRQFRAVSHPKRNLPVLCYGIFIVIPFRSNRSEKFFFLLEKISPLSY